MFCKSQGVTMQTTHMDDGLIVWKEYENCLTLIGAARGLTERVLTDLLDLAFNAVISCVSLNELRQTKNVEHLKKGLIKVRQTYRNI